MTENVPPFERRVHLIMGKGGVGRTTVAVSMAQAAALRGKRVLLTEVGDPEATKSAIGAFFGREELRVEPEHVAPGIDACRLWAEKGQESFARTVLPTGPRVKTALRSRAMRRLMSAAPAFHELGIFYHLLSLLELCGKDGQEQYSAVIVDMPATGHALALAELPKITLQVISRGPLPNAMRRGQAYINNPAVTAAWVVTLPEQLPVTESLELLEGLKRTGVPAAGVILNRHLDNYFSKAEIEVIEGALQDHPVRGTTSFQRIQTADRSSTRLRESTDLPIVQLDNIVNPINGDPSPALANALNQVAGSLR